MARWNTVARGASLVAIGALALAACSSSSDQEPSNSASGDAPAGSGDALRLGAILPQTGTLAYLGPPAIAGVNTALSEVNDNGGVNGQDVTINLQDSGDAQHPEIVTGSVSTLIADGVSAIIGAESSSVTKLVIDDITGAKIVEFSPANTATDLSGYSDYYFRTSPPDTVQGNALAQQMMKDGNDKIAVLVFNDSYGTSLRDVIVKTVEGAGGTITYGHEGEEFDPAATNFAAIVQAALATDPDAIALIAFDQTVQIVPSLISSGFPADKLYLTDGNTADYSGDFEPGTLEGAQGTIPGPDAPAAFKERLNATNQDSNGEDLDSYAYGAEAYDATMLIALAAVRAGDTLDGTALQQNLPAVSGSDGGTECSGFKECADLLASGEEINYQAVSGVGPFNEANDPESAYIGLFKYDANNVPQYTEAVYGEVPTD